MSLFGFEVPHAHMQCVADKIRVQVPYPPKKIGSILTPSIWRDLSQHVHQMGIVRGMGPMAFRYQDDKGEPIKQAPVKIGDWVLFKWGAGTSFNVQAGVSVDGGWRYLSSFNDVISWCSLEHMPNPDTLNWDEATDEVAQAFNNGGGIAGQDAFNFDSRKLVDTSGDFQSGVG